MKRRKERLRNKPLKVTFMDRLKALNDRKIFQRLSILAIFSITAPPKSPPPKSE